MILGSHLSSPNPVRPLKALPPRSERTMLSLFLETPCGAAAQPLLEQVGITVSPHPAPALETLGFSSGQERGEESRASVTGPRITWAGEDGTRG